MIPLSPLSPIQRIGYLDGEILCREAIGPFVPGRRYRVAIRTGGMRLQELSLDALGRQNKIDLRSKETLVVIDSEAGPRGFTPDTLRRCCTNVPLLGDYEALLRCFEIPDVPDVARVFPAETAAALDRVADLQTQIALRRPGFSFLPYQREDLARSCLTDGVLLAWMTGLGKALALFTWPLLRLGWLADDILYPPEPALIIAPDELLEQHREECRRFLGVYPMVLTRFDGIYQEGLYLTGYHKLTRNIGTLQNPAAFTAVAMDEGTKIKSADSLMGRAARTLAPRYRMIATATPIKNRIQDLFWLLWWVAGAKRKPHPGFPYSINGQDTFARWHLTQAINRTRAAEAAKKTGYYRGYARSTARACNLPHLWRIAAPYLLRRRKEDVAGMVAKIEHQIVLPMNPEQERVYRALLDRPFRDVNGLPATFAKLQALRVAAVVPNCRSLPIFTDELSTPKLELCLRLIGEIVEQGEPCVVFSAFHAATDALAARLTGLALFAALDGRQAPDLRAQVAAKFANGDFPILLAGDNSMGFGFNFAHCRHVIRTSPEWPLDISEQPPDRCHRLTSRQDVHVYSLICAGTIEAAVERLLIQKRQSAQLALDGGVEIPDAGQLLGLAVEEAHLSRPAQEQIKSLSDLLQNAIYEQPGSGVPVLGQAPLEILMRTPTTTIPPRPNGPPATKTRMAAFRFEDETKAKLEANARAANCTQTAMLKYLIDWYYDEHTSKIPRPAKGE